MTLHFSGLKVSCHFFDQSCDWFRSFCNLDTSSSLIISRIILSHLHTDISTDILSEEYENDISINTCHVNSENVLFLTLMPTCLFYNLNILFHCFNIYSVSYKRWPVNWLITQQRTIHTATFIQGVAALRMWFVRYSLMCQTVYFLFIAVLLTLYVY